MVPVFHRCVPTSSPCVAYKYWHLIEFIISKWMSESRADFSPSPFPRAVSPVCNRYVFGVSYPRLEVLGWTSGHILKLFTGEEGTKSSALERMWGMELITISVFQTKANKRLVGFLWSPMSQPDLFPDLVRTRSQDSSMLCLFPSTAYNGLLQNTMTT